MNEQEARDEGTVAAVKPPALSAQWAFWGEDLPPLTGKANGRTLTIRPRELTVHSRRPDLSDLSVYIEGTTIKANGDDGQHRRTHVFSTRPSFDEPTLDALPAWARAYVDHARVVLAPPTA